VGVFSLFALRVTCSYDQACGALTDPSSVFSVSDIVNLPLSFDANVWSNVNGSLAVTRFLEPSVLPSPELILRALAGRGVRKPGNRVEYVLPTESLVDLASMISPLPLRFASVLVAEPFSAADPGAAGTLHQQWHADDATDAGAMRAIIYLSDVSQAEAGALEFFTPDGPVAVLGPVGTVGGNSSSC
jgi:hypothetical protein